MKVINLHAGPGSGKSTLASLLFYKLKVAGFKTELVGEFAKELVYSDNKTQLVNQVYILGQQYKRLKDLERSGVDIAISDSPLMLQIYYSKGRSYYSEIVNLVKVLNSEFDNIDVFVNRTKKYQGYGRTQTLEEAVEIDNYLRNTLSLDFMVDSNEEGANMIIDVTTKIYQ
jgi:adenylate kinase family enzyme